MSSTANCSSKEYLASASALRTLYSIGHCGSAADSMIIPVYWGNEARGVCFIRAENGVRAFRDW